MELLEIIARALASLTGLLHVWIFIMESVLWMRPSIYRRFAVPSKEQATQLKDVMLNQGYYNLFLALGSLFGAAFFTSIDGAATVLLYSNLCIAGAGAVLLISKPALFRAALIQGLPALAAVVTAFLSL